MLSTVTIWTTHVANKGKTIAPSFLTKFLEELCKNRENPTRNARVVAFLVIFLTVVLLKMADLPRPCRRFALVCSPGTPVVPLGYHLARIDSATGSIAKPSIRYDSRSKK